MARLTLDLPETLHDQLVASAEREGVQLQQYILYILARQTGSAYTVQVMSEADIAEQEADYLALRQAWGTDSPAQVEAVLAKREEVAPEPALKPDVIEKVRQRIKEKRGEALFISPKSQVSDPVRSQEDTFTDETIIGYSAEITKLAL